MINCYLIGDTSILEGIQSCIENCPHTTLLGISNYELLKISHINKYKPDIIFIQQDTFNELDVYLNHLRNLAPIVIISDQVDYAFNAFESLAFDYLCTPVKKERFLKCIFKYEMVFRNLLKERNFEISKKHFFVKVDTLGHKKVRIEFEYLLFLQAMQNYVVISIEGGQKFHCYNSLKEMEEVLPKSNFIRIHRSFIVNSNKIQSIEGNKIFLIGDEDFGLIIGNTYKKDFHKMNNWNLYKKPNSQKSDLNELLAVNSLVLITIYFNIINWFETLI